MERTGYKQTLPRTELFTLTLPSPSGCARGLRCSGSADSKELLQEETSEDQNWQNWLNAGLHFVTSDFVQMGERAELSISHMDTENSSLPTLQGRQSMNTC